MAILQPGQTIGVRVGPVIHPGIVSEYIDAYGSPMIYSNSFRSGCVALEPLAVFKGPYEFMPIAQPANLPIWQVLSRARQMLDMRWNLLSWNCEHFVSAAFGLQPQSPQLRIVGTMLGLTVFLTMTARA